MCFNETYNTVRIGKCLCDKFPTQNGLKEGEDSTPLLFNFAEEEVTRRVLENQEGLALNATHQLSAYAYDINIVGENIKTIKKNTEALLQPGKEFDPEVNPEKTKYMLKSCSQKAGQMHSIKIVNRSFEMRRSSNTSEQHYRMKIAWTKRLRAD
jgi:hypothetical protein